MTDVPLTIDSTTPLRRESGAFAMLAVDQREAMRLMFADDAAPESDGSVPEQVQLTVSDQKLTDFKLEASRVLTPYASGVLLDRQFVWDAAMAQGVVAGTCAPIIAADRFIAGHGEVVTDVELDDEIDYSAVREQGAVAAKLLIIYRSDEAGQSRIDMVRDFVARCQAAGLVSIIEPVCKAARKGEFDWNAGVLAAAKELGGLGADLYKAEVPLHGKGTDEELITACRALDSEIASPWVVLSSGVSADAFPRAVRLACRAGASGFLAGRAVWRECVGAEDLSAALETDAVQRLQRLVEVVDLEVGGR